MRKIIGKRNKVHYVEEKKKFLLRKSSTRGWFVVGISMFGMFLFSAGAPQASAAEWVANSPEQISSRITEGQKSLTMVEGDTVWNIGVALNIKDPMQLLFDNGFKDGEQFSIPVGTVISWDGNHITVTDPAGNVVKETTVQDSDKMDASKTVAGQASDTPSKDYSTTTNGNNAITGNTGNTAVNTGTNTGTNGGSTVVTPDKGSSNNGGSNVTPDKGGNNNGGGDKPVDPVTPEKTELQKLEALLAEQKAKLAELNAKLPVAEKALADAKQKLADAENGENSVEALTEKVNAQQAVVTDLQAKIDASAADIQAKETAMNTAKQELDAAKNTVNPDLEAQIKAAEAKVAETQAATEPVSQTLRDLMASAAAKYPDLAKQIYNGNFIGIDDSALAERLNSAKVAVDQAFVAYIQANDALAALKASGNGNEDLIAQKQAAYDTAKGAYDTAVANAATDKAKLPEATQLLNDLKAKLEAAQTTDIATLKKDVELKQAEVDQIKAEIEKVTAEIKETEKKIADIKLKVERQDAITSIKNMKYLSDDARNGYIGRVNGTLTTDEINGIVAEAKAADDAAKAVYDLNQAKNEAETALNKLTALSDQEKTDFIGQAKSAANIDAVNAIVTKAMEINTFNQAKKDGVTKINGLSSLSDQEKAKFIEQINAAANASAVTAIVNEASALNTLNETKVSAEKTINALNYLTKTEKADFIDQVKTAKDSGAIQGILDQATKINQEAKLKELRTQAEKSINGLSDLSDKEKADFVAQLPGAATEDAIAQILTNAKALSAANKIKADAVKTVNALTDLSDQEKADFAAQIKTATTTDAVNSIVKAAQDKAAANKAKAEAEKTINALTDLSETEKADFIGQVKNARTVAEVNNIVKAAQEKAEANKIKADAIQTVKALPNLSDEVKAQIVDQLTAAQTTKEVEQILKDAKAKDALVQEAKEAKAAIAKLTDLSEADRAGYVGQIDAATTSEAIQAVVKTATAQNAVAKEQNAAIVKIEAMKFLTADQKVDFTKQVKAATTSDAIQAVLAKATQTNEDAKALEDVKTDAIEATKQYTHVSEAVRSQAVSDIKVATSKDAVKKVLADLAEAEKAAIAKELADAKTAGIEKINALKFLTANQKTDFTSKINAVTSKDAIAPIVAEAEKQNEIESKKGTITFTIKDFDGNIIKTVEKRMTEGNYSVTLADLGIIDSTMKYVSGDLTGTVVKQTNKDVTINVADTHQVQTVIIHAKDIDTGKIVETKTFYFKAGDKIALDTFKLMNFDPKQWKDAGGYEFELTARAGDTEEFTTKIRQSIALNEKQCQDTQVELVKLINEYRLSKGIAAMTVDTRAQQAADIRAKEIAKSFSHTRPDGQAFQTVLTEVGLTHLTAGGENIAMTFGIVNDPVKSAQMLFDKWKESPGHNRNMLTDGYTNVVFGVYADETGIYSSTVFIGLPDK
ncbi:CAP domain-containing protein [Enterococcus hirae]|nr:CAP domain-containing protein [Enterococcus hirae]